MLRRPECQRCSIASELTLGEAIVEHGNLAIPTDQIVGGARLIKWLNEQKQIMIGNRKGKQLTDEQTAKLRSIGSTVGKINGRKAVMRTDAERHGAQI